METKEDRTVVVSGVPDVLPASRIIDKLTIHFQSRRRSHGGDVELVHYPTNMDGVAFVTFDEANDAERVVQREEQVLTDGQFSQDYPLTVFPFTRDVFLYVSSATVDLSIFGHEEAALLHRLRSAHRSVHFKPLHQQRKVTIEGPFSAVRALREELIRRAGQLTPAVKLNETHNAKAVLDHEVGFEGLSAPLQTTGENSEDQSLISCSKDSDFEHDNTGSLSKRSTRGKSRKVFGGPGINAEIRSPLSDLDPAEGISVKQPGVRHISLNHSRPSSGENDSSGSAGSQREKDRHSSAGGAKPLQTRPKDVSIPSDAGEMPAACLEELKDTSIWVDSDTFKYIQTFDRGELDSCLRGLDVSIKGDKGADLTQILVTGEQTSRVKKGLDYLKFLVELWRLSLRVHWIHFDDDKKPEGEEVTKICDDEIFWFNDVLYMLEDRCVKIIGPSTSSYLFYSKVKERISQL
ncbi:uncharacterized protein ACBR49_019861 [Aulostomus maculatus]